MDCCLESSALESGSQRIRCSTPRQAGRSICFVRVASSLPAAWRSATASAPPTYRDGLLQEQLNGQIVQAVSPASSALEEVQRDSSCHPTFGLKRAQNLQPSFSWDLLQLLPAGLAEGVSMTPLLGVK